MPFTVDQNLLNLDLTSKEAVAAYANQQTNGDAIQTTAAQTGLLNKLTGTVGKGLDTFLDALAIGAANKVVGTQYPTGQLSPEQVAAQQRALQQTQGTGAGQTFNWRPYVIGGGILVSVIVLAAVLLPRRS